MEGKWNEFDNKYRDLFDLCPPSAPLSWPTYIKAFYNPNHQPQWLSHKKNNRSSPMKTRVNGKGRSLRAIQIVCGNGGAFGVAAIEE